MTIPTAAIAPAAVAPFPHYSHQAATIGISILAIVIIVAVIAAIRTNRRRR
ncbi:hypothetical protein GCM10023195_12750 [Actinoallomurus liliacearum]|uniref:Gram-positive cocci surface proteins LPxTG domain-containing protein n=1 Tax=Actinoallomurus liliacearum TaxID=1080073 RepID=A0ABP8TEP8_9ACTN